MTKVSLEEIEAKMLEFKVEPATVVKIIKELEKAAEEIKQDKETTAPKTKYEFVIVLNDKEDILKDKEIAGWVVQQQTGEDAGTILSKLSDAAKAQNDVTKKKKNMITDLSSLFSHLKSKFTKEKNIRIKTKELVSVIISNGTLV